MEKLKECQAEGIGDLGFDPTVKFRIVNNWSPMNFLSHVRVKYLITCRLFRASQDTFSRQSRLSCGYTECRCLQIS